MRYAPWCLVLLAVLGSRTATAAPLLVNGSFELGPDLGSFDDQEFLVGSTVITGWTITGDATDTVDYLGSPWDVSRGQHAIDLDGRNSTNAGIAQTFLTVIGDTYRVRFALSGNPEGGPTVKELRVEAGGVSHDYAFDVTGLSKEALVWDTIKFSFLASGPLSTLSFTSLTPFANSYGALVDRIGVVPEPAMLWLLGMGVALGIRRARR